MKNPRRLLWPGAALTAVLGVGCLNLEPQPDLTRFHVLASPGVEPGESPSGALPVFVGRVEVPAYLQTPAIATRLSETELGFSPDHHWAEPLPDGVTRVVRDALAACAGADRIHPDAFRRPSGAYLEAQVTLTRFEFSAEGSALLAARWNVLRQPGAQRAAAGESQVRHSFAFEPNDYGPAIAALSRCLADLGREIHERGLERVEP